MRGRETEKQKQRTASYYRRIGRIRGFGMDSIPRERPSAREHFDRKPYGLEGEKDG